MLNNFYSLLFYDKKHIKFGFIRLKMLKILRGYFEARDNQIKFAFYFNDKNNKASVLR